MPDAWELTVCPFCGSHDINRRHTGGVNDQQCATCWAYWSEADVPTLGDRHICPQRREASAAQRATPFANGSDYWHVRDGRRHCSYCGSWNPDDFMEQARSGIILGTTTKNYKVYVAGGPFTKFYWEHLSPEQRQEFVDLFNARQTISFEGGLGFNPLPFFMSRG